jgi:uncharacterized protein (DUF4415 family)
MKNLSLDDKTEMKKTKVLVRIELDLDVLDSFKSTGKGSQNRMNNALKEWLKEHPDLSHV